MTCFRRSMITGEIIAPVFHSAVQERHIAEMMQMRMKRYRAVERIPYKGKAEVISRFRIHGVDVGDARVGCPFGVGVDAEESGDEAAATRLLVGDPHEPVSAGDHASRFPGYLPECCQYPSRFSDLSTRRFPNEIADNGRRRHEPQHAPPLPPPAMRAVQSGTPYPARMPSVQEEPREAIIYLPFRGLVGRGLRHVAVPDGRRLALIGWRTGAFELKARDEWIGWLPEQRFRRLR